MVRRWLINDWKYNRPRLIIESLGTIFVLTSMFLLSIYGSSANLYLVFILQAFGCLFFSINAILRQSINMLIINFGASLIAIYGLINLFYN